MRYAFPNEGSLLLASPGPRRPSTPKMQCLLKFGALALVIMIQSSTASAQGTSFTYQGRLDANGSPASGVYDFRFRAAVDSNGNNFVGSTSLAPGVPVNNGLFVTN